jgi:toxin ParE1/3/4
MSSPSAGLRLSPAAQKDFADILRYTGETWGPEQLLAYRDKLNDALLRLARNPAIGHRRPDLPDTHRAHIVGAHVIVFRTGSRGTEVVRILHQRMQIPRRL